MCVCVCQCEYTKTTTRDTVLAQQKFYNHILFVVSFLSSEMPHMLVDVIT